MTGLDETRAREDRTLRRSGLGRHHTAWEGLGLDRYEGLGLRYSEVELGLRTDS